MPCEHCVSRRDFLGTAVGAAGLVVLTACGDGFLSAPVNDVELPTGPLVVKVGDFPDLATVGKLFKLPGRFIAVKRVDDTTFDAFSMFCTHQGCATDLVGQQFVCPCHGSRFRDDGGVVQGPAAESLGKFTTVYDPGTDNLTIS
jgi:cytochrome b6-f complex iron-sulfur subunit